MMPGLAFCVCLVSFGCYRREQGTVEMGRKDWDAGQGHADQRCRMLNDDDEIMDGAGYRTRQHDIAHSPCPSCTLAFLDVIIKVEVTNPNFLCSALCFKWFDVMEKPMSGICLRSDTDMLGSHVTVNVRNPSSSSTDDKSSERASQ